MSPRENRQRGEPECKRTYPELRSRMIFTLTGSPVELLKRVFTKASSIQLSRSPILFGVSDARYGEDIYDTDHRVRAASLETGWVADEGMEVSMPLLPLFIGASKPPPLLLNAIVADVPAQIVRRRGWWMEESNEQLGRAEGKWVKRRCRRVLVSGAGRQDKMRERKALRTIAWECFPGCFPEGGRSSYFDSGWHDVVAGKKGHEFRVV